MVNQKYALGVNSCSSAIMLALMAVGVEPGDQVITNGFTFTALPSTIMRLGAEPVFVEASRSFTMDLDDLEKKMAAFPDAKVLLLSHMRGKVTDMDRVVEICEKNGVTLVEDCAHGCGVTWRGRQLGYHAKVAASVRRRGSFSDASRRRRGRDVAIPWRRVAATSRLGRTSSVEMSRGDVATATWLIRGDESRRRRGWDADSP